MKVFSLEKFRILLIALLPIAVMSYDMAFTNALFYISAAVGLYTLKTEKAKWLNIEKIILILLLLCCGGLLISNFFSVYDADNSIKWARRYCYWMLPLLLMYGLWFNNNNCRKAFIYGGLLGSFLLIGYAVYQNQFLNIQRAYSVTTNPNSYSAIICMVFPFVLFYIKNNLLKILTVGIYLYGIMISGSRGSFLAFCLVLLIYIYFLKKHTEHKFTKKYTAIILLFVMIFAGIGINQIQNNSVTIFSRFQNMTKQSIYKTDSERIYLWQSSFKMIKDYTWHGVGLRNFNKVYIDGNYINPNAKEPDLQSPHNIVLHYLTEMGIIGTVPFVVLFGYLFLWCKRNIDNVLAIGLLSSLFVICLNNMVDYQFIVKQYYQLFWLILGAVMADVYFCRKIK